MKNQIATHNQITNRSSDPVLEVEQWKDAVYEETKNMSPDQLQQYYQEAVEFVEQKRKTT